MIFVAKFCIWKDKQMCTLWYLIVFLLKFLLHNKWIFQFVHSMWLWKVSFCTLTFDFVLKYLEYLIKMSLTHPHLFSYFLYSSMESSMFYHPLNLLNGILFILKYVFKHLLRPIWSTFEPNWFISYSLYLSI